MQKMNPKGLMMNIDNPDKVAIEAVKHGDRDRFSELVERHKRMVYAIAWSYLGDAEICEDAAQETFIRAFRYLGALRDIDHFPAWLSRIARNVSATLLRRRRAELENRKRWQTEQPVPTTVPPDAAEDEENLKEMLGRTLVELPPQHRECLVLFYMEGKSIRETATILGLSETAIKARLHRARRTLRGKLEQQIEQGLNGLTPRKGFVASVMFLLPAKPLGVVGFGGGVSLIGKITSWLGGLLPSMIFMFWMTLGQGTFLYLINRWYAHLEIANIIDKPEHEFRKALLRRNALTKSLGMIGAMILAFFAIWHFNIFTFYQILAIFCAWGTYKTARLLRVNRSLHAWGNVLSIFSFFFVFVLIGFFSATLGLIFIVMLLLNVMLIRTNRDAPRRHDYNLFLRQANGILGQTEVRSPLPHRATETEQRAFARFLGEQWLVQDYSIDGAAMLLRLTPARITLHGSYFMIYSSNSVVIIQPDGACHATLSRSDAKAIAAILKRPIDTKALEEGIGRVIQEAFALFLRGQMDEAKGLLSTLGDEAIFLTDFSKTKGYRLQHGFAIAASLMLVLWFVSQPDHWGNLRWFQEWNPQPVSQVMARDAVGEWIRKDSRSARADLLYLWGSPIHPSMALLGEQNAAGYKRIVADTLRIDIDDRVKNAAECRIVNGLLNPHLLYHAIATPILSTQELAALGFTADKVRKTLAGFQDGMHARRTPMDKIFEIPHTSCVFNGIGTDYKALNIETFAFRLSILKTFGCLDLVDSDAVAKTIASHQITNRFRLPDDFIPVDTNLNAGLFHMGHCSLSETWAALWVLETLGRLDSIDREACIQGILRLYHGKGIFKADDPLKSGAMMWGNTTRDEDAFYAMESLARLHALDRINDFQKWKFHPVTETLTVDHKTSPGHVTGASLLSLAYQERLEWHLKSMYTRVIE